MWLPKGNVLPNKWIAFAKSSSGVELLWDISTMWGLLSSLLIKDSIQSYSIFFPSESEFDLKNASDDLETQIVVKIELWTCMNAYQIHLSLIFKVMCTAKTEIILALGKGLFSQAFTFLSCYHTHISQTQFHLSVLINT